MKSRSSEIEPRSEKDQARFWAKVALPNDNGCMLWLAWRQSNGYGRFFLGGRVVFAHHYSHVLAHGRIPVGAVVDHSCGNPSCVAPLHLEAVTQRENLLRGETVTADQIRRTHCPRGHPYDEANTYTRHGSRTGRNCRACGRANTARRRKAQREAA